MQDCYCERDTGISNFKRWDSGVNHFNAPRTGSPLTRIYEKTDLRESPKKPSHATTLWDRVSIPSTNVFNLVSRMTIHAENIHSLLHLLQRSTLHGVKLHKKLWRCSQRRLKGDNLVGGLLFYKYQIPKVLVSCMIGIGIGSYKQAGFGD